MLNVCSNRNIEGKPNQIKYFSAVVLNNVEIQKSNGYYIWDLANCQMVKEIHWLPIP